MRVLKLRGDLDLAQEALGPERGGELRAEHLDRHLATMAQIFGQIDRGHPALPDLAVEHVAFTKGGGQAGERARGVQEGPLAVTGETERPKPTSLPLFRRGAVATLRQVLREEIQLPFVDHWELRQHQPAEEGDEYPPGEGEISGGGEPSPLAIVDGIVDEGPDRIPTLRRVPAPSPPLQTSTSGKESFGRSGGAGISWETERWAFDTASVRVSDHVPDEGSGHGASPITSAPVLQPSVTGTRTGSTAFLAKATRHEDRVELVRLTCGQGFEPLAFADRHRDRLERPTGLE